MNKTTANHHARELYRAAMMRGKFETTQREWHAVYYPDDNCVVVTYVGPKNEDDIRQHVCMVRKNWL